MFDTGLVKDLARLERGYNVTDAASGEVLSRYRTRAAAVDSWREAHAGVAVRIIRRDSNGEESLIVEGIWHEAHRWGCDAGPVGTVDPNDDSSHRYVVWHFRFDPSRNERRNVVVAAFDTQEEFFADLGARQVELAELKRHGLAEMQELLGGYVKPVGYAKMHSQRDRGRGCGGRRVRKRNRSS